MTEREKMLRGEPYDYGAQISIGARAWLGGGVIVLPGISIGEDAVTGAGSVVTRPVAGPGADGQLAAG